MFLYQNKINNKDSMILLCQTVDEGKQSPIQNGEVLALYENENNDLVCSAGEFTDGEFTPDAPVTNPYLTFSSPNSFTLAVELVTWDGTMEYSTDTQIWETWRGSLITSNSDNEIYLRGKENKVISLFSSSRFILTGSNISCSGDIRTLLNYEDVENTTMMSSCFSYLFSGNASLIKAPSLPATTLVKSCYESMFKDCTSLTIAPELPATTLADSCYGSMFRGCTSLTTPPVLPVTTLASSCYTNMFYGCTSLTTLPALPATTLASQCYYQMFYNCSSLTTLPNLPATTLQPDCYRAMFQNCSKIKLSATQTGEYVNEYRIPTMGTGTTALRAVNNMLTGTGGTFQSSPYINTTYYTSNTVV